MFLMAENNWKPKMDVFQTVFFSPVGVAIKPTVAGDEGNDLGQ